MWIGASELNVDAGFERFYPKNRQSRAAKPAKSGKGMFCLLIDLQEQTHSVQLLRSMCYFGN